MQFELHKKAGQTLKQIEVSPSVHLIIHYSCESFYDIEDGRTPRITSIAIYSYDTGQTDSFSIHKVAEKKGVALTNIENEYDQLEKQMLEEYFEYLRNHNESKWIHWNMRDMNYGFKAIEHRFEVLGGTPHSISDEKKIDLARVLKHRYGSNYADDPRMEKLLAFNGSEPKDFLKGSEEAEAFKNKEYVKLHLSTLRKVSEIGNILTSAIDGTLKVKTKWYEIYGLSPQGVFEFIRNRWWTQLILYILTLLLGGIIGVLIGKQF